MSRITRIFHFAALVAFVTPLAAQAQDVEPVQHDERSSYTDMEPRLVDERPSDDIDPDFEAWYAAIQDCLEDGVWVLDGDQVVFIPEPTWEECEEVVNGTWAMTCEEIGQEAYWDCFYTYQGPILDQDDVCEFERRIAEWECEEEGRQK